MHALSLRCRSLEVHICFKKAPSSRLRHQPLKHSRIHSSPTSHSCLPRQLGSHSSALIGVVAFGFCIRPHLASLTRHGALPRLADLANHEGCILRLRSSQILVKRYNRMLIHGLKFNGIAERSVMVSLSVSRLVERVASNARHHAPLTFSHCPHAIQFWH